MKALLFLLGVAFGVMGSIREAGARPEAGLFIEPIRFSEQDFSTGGPSNLFPLPRGVYSGLILSSNNFVAEQSGDFQIWVGRWGDFSGSMDVGGRLTWFWGWFNRQGQAGLRIYRRVWDDCCFFDLRLAWIVTLEIVAGTDEIRGTVENVRQGWTADLFGYRGRDFTMSPAPEEGRYTLRFPGSVDPATAPGGDGYAAVTVNRWGRLFLAGRLADGVAFTSSVVVSTNGWWPIYAPLSQGRGAFIGWMKFEDQPGSDVGGDLRWYLARREGRRTYPDGFTGSVAATGSRYSMPGFSETALGWTNGTVSFSGGNLAAPLTNGVTLLPGGGLSVNGGGVDSFSFSLRKSLGLFRGGFRHPATGRRVSYSGALIQKQGLGTGFFIGVDQGGLFRLEPAP